MEHSTNRLTQTAGALVFILACGIFYSCTYRKTDMVVMPPPGCDTMNVRYSTNIVSILSANCYTCHSGSAGRGAGYKLDTYTNLKVFVNNGSLLGVVSHAPGFSAMPKGASKLADCDIATIRAWINKGALNN